MSTTVHDEGCVCGHGPYVHVWHGPAARLLRLNTACSRCDCREFRRVAPRDVFIAGCVDGIAPSQCDKSSSGGLCDVCGLAK